MRFSTASPPITASQVGLRYQDGKQTCLGRLPCNAAVEYHVRDQLGCMLGAGVDALRIFGVVRRLIHFHLGEVGADLQPTKLYCKWAAADSLNL